MVSVPLEIPEHIKYELNLDKGAVYRYVSYPGLYEVTIYLCRYYIIKETPKGAWINYPSIAAGKKLIMNNSRNSFAFRTREEALINFKYRKHSQIRHLNNSLDLANKSLHKLPDVIKDNEKYAKYATLAKIQQIDKLLV